MSNLTYKKPKESGLYWVRMKDCRAYVVRVYRRKGELFATCDWYGTPQPVKLFSKKWKWSEKI